MRQIGNAVPVNFAYIIASSIRVHLQKLAESKKILGAVIFGVSQYNGKSKQAEFYSASDSDKVAKGVRDARLTSPVERDPPACSADSPTEFKGFT